MNLIEPQSTREPANRPQTRAPAPPQTDSNPAPPPNLDRAVEAFNAALQRLAKPVKRPTRY